MPDAAMLGARLKRGPSLLLDGPVGTELERRGADLSGRLWSARTVLEQPVLVRTVHEDYVRAGAEVVTAATFRTNPSAFHDAGYGEATWRRTVGTAIRLAKEAAQTAHRDVWVAGSMAPIGDCYSPGEVPDDDSFIEREHARHAEALRAAGADLLLIETMNTVREAGIAARVAKRTGLPVWVSFVVGPGARLLSNEPLDAALMALGETAPDAVLVNCCTLGAVEDALAVFRRGEVPWGAYGNAAEQTPRAGMVPGREVSVDRYVAAAHAWLDLGMGIVGGCCGTGPGYTEALRGLLDGLSKPQQ